MVCLLPASLSNGVATNVGYKPSAPVSWPSPVVVPANPSTFDISHKPRKKRVSKTVFRTTSPTHAILDPQSAERDPAQLSFSVYRKQTLYEKTISNSSSLLQRSAPLTADGGDAQPGNSQTQHSAFDLAGTETDHKPTRGRPRKDVLPMVYSAKRSQSLANRRAQRRWAALRDKNDESMAALAAVAGVEVSAMENAIQGSLQERTEAHQTAGTSTSAARHHASGRVTLRVPPPHALARKEHNTSRETYSAMVSLIRASSKHKLLTKDEEHELLMHLQEGNRIRDVESSLTASLGRAPLEVELMCAAGVKTTRELQLRRDRACQAKEHLLRCNVRLVLKIAASQHRKHNVSLDDLMLVGLQGLQKGFDKFDMSRGFKLSTYCYWWILDAVTRAFAELDRCHRLPKATLEQLYKLYGASQALFVANGRPPTREELMQRTGFSAFTLDRLQKLRRRNELSIEGTLTALNKSNDGRLSGSSQSTLGDLLVDQSCPDPSDLAVQLSIRGVLEAAVQKLPPREAHLICLLYGLEGNAPLTRKEVALVLNISPARIGQLHLQALQLLRTVGLHELAEVSSMTAQQLTAQQIRPTRRSISRPKEARMRSVEVPQHRQGRRAMTMVIP